MKCCEGRGVKRRASFREAIPGPAGRGRNVPSSAAFLAAARVPWTDYVLGTAIGILPRTALATFAAAGLEQLRFKNVDQRKENVTLRNLLRMKSGINFYEDPYEGSPLQQLNHSSGDWLRIIFDQPMNAEPGELWQYNSGGVISLGGVIYNAGQWLFIVPRHDIVVAATSNGSGYTGYIDPIDFLYSSILPAVR